MKSFTFSLQSVLTIKQLEKNKAAQALNTIVQKRLKIERVVHEKIQQLQCLTQSFNKTVTQGILAGMKSNYNEYMIELLMEINRLINEIDRCKIDENEAMQVFLKAYQNEQAVIKLKEKKYKNYVKSLERWEEKQLEDMITARY